VLGFRGLALGTAIAANINAGLLLILLGRRIGGVDGARIGQSFAKILLASVVMGVVAHVASEWLRVWLPGDGVSTRSVRVGVAIGLSLATLAATAWALRIQEFRTAVGRVVSRVKA
jgi:putative peptidoglycan lipid II flippase